MNEACDAKRAAVPKRNLRIPGISWELQKQIYTSNETLSEGVVLKGCRGRGVSQTPRPLLPVCGVKLPNSWKMELFVGLVPLK